jgi:hypothetical protein
LEKEITVTRLQDEELQKFYSSPNGLLLLVTKFQDIVAMIKSRRINWGMTFNSV